MYIKGVNLGNWLVLEKWMSPALFDGVEAEDEYYLAHRLPKEIYEARMKIHRSEYITERDFAKIARMGLNMVRLPVPYFIFGDREPFIACLTEVDHAFSWAEKYGLKILIDMHTVPWSQNGFDNGGLSGVCKWSQKPEEVEYVLQVLEKLAKRYGHRKGLFGIEPVNEPITEPMWSRLGGVENYRYPAADPEMAKGSRANTMEFIRQYYEASYQRLKPLMAEDKYLVFHDGFRMKEWKGIFPRGKYTNVILDTHQYLMTAELHGCEQNPDAYERYIREHYAADIEEVQEYMDVICGEWCLFNSYCVGADTNGGRSSLHGKDYGKLKEKFTMEEKSSLYQRIGKAQLEAWKKGSGFVYWSYKLLLDTVNEPEWIGWDCWDLDKCYDLGWISFE